jgi:hypothetical protein
MKVGEVAAKAWCRAALRTALVAASCAALFAAPGCTYLWQTNVNSLPERMKFPEFSFAPPQGQGWYHRNVSDPPEIAQFTKHGPRSETQILVTGYQPPGRVTDIDELIEFSENLPGGDKIVAPAPGHGATCVRYHARSLLSVNYANTTTNPYTDVMVTDEDSLDCIDPRYPNYLVRFIFSQRSPKGGTPEGSREADAFIQSIRFSARE